LNEEEFLDKYRSEKDMYKSLGEYIVKYVEEKCRENDISEEWFCIKPSCRVKDETSILGKAYLRGKNYSNPYEDITDKVGVRFVLLTINRLKKIKELISKQEIFSASEDRNFEEERRKQPTKFEYQSVHYIIRPKADIEYNGIIIKSGIPCEVQIRTLLQHAYSELTHDTIYKPKQTADPDIHRLIARSMALIETTDCIFVEAENSFNCVSRIMNELLIGIQNKYSKIIEFDYDEKINKFILDSYQEEVKAIPINKIIQFIDSKLYILDRIGERISYSLLYRQPVIILLYYLVYSYPTVTNEKWPLESEDLNSVYADLGLSRA
jgi:putative GTP pyrophosphokinase